MLIGNTQANFNGTNAPAQMTSTSTASGTLSASADGSLQVGISAKLASASAAFGTTFSASNITQRTTAGIQAPFRAGWETWTS